MNEIDIDHNILVSKLAKPGADIIATLTPEKAHIWHMASALQSEAGELFDAIKKPVIYNKKEIDRVNVVEELGDMEFYMAGIRQGLGISRRETLIANMEKLGVRYGDKYSDNAAQARADKTPGA